LFILVVRVDDACVVVPVDGVADAGVVASSFLARPLAFLHCRHCSSDVRYSIARVSALNPIVVVPSKDCLRCCLIPSSSVCQSETVLRKK